MGYVQSLLRGKLDLHREELVRYKALGEFDNVASCLGVIAEIELALELLNNSDSYLYK